MESGVGIVLDRKVALKFDTFPTDAHDELLTSITSLTEELRSKVEGAVPKKTGQLASMIVSGVQDDPARITGYVAIKGGTRNEMVKAAAEEYGAHGVAHVRAHRAKLGHLFGKLVEPIEVLKEAYDRRVNVTARGFLKIPTEEIASEALDELRAAMGRAAVK